MRVRDLRTLDHSLVKHCVLPHLFALDADKLIDVVIDSLTHCQYGFAYVLEYRPEWLDAFIGIFYIVFPIPRSG